MGDKGGKKDKAKNQKQKASKQEKKKKGKNSWEAVLDWSCGLRLSEVHSSRDTSTPQSDTHHWTADYTKTELTPTRRCSSHKKEIDDSHSQNWMCLFRQLQALRGHASQERAKMNQWFFKTGKGEYAEGDRFIVLTVPQMWPVVNQYPNRPFAQFLKRLSSKIHEERLLALLILVVQFKREGTNTQKQIANAYSRFSYTEST